MQNPKLKAEKKSPVVVFQGPGAGGWGAGEMGRFWSKCTHFQINKFWES